MTPKELRDKLFSRGRPFLRPLEILNGAGYSQDLKTLYIAHKHDPFNWAPEDIPADGFMSLLEDWSENIPFIVTEDSNSAFNDRGIVALVTMENDGWKLQPHVDFMPWASPRNMLLSTVAFFQKIRYDSEVGVCIVHARSRTLFDHAAKYFPPGFIRKVGKIPMGFPEGNDYIYSVRGRKQWAE